MKYIKHVTLLLVLSSLFFSCNGLKTAVYDQYSYQKSIEIKVEASSLIDKATTSYADHLKEVSELSLEIQKIIERLNPQIESMEGAAFFYVCQQKKQQCIQLRAISNYVEKRNRKSWKVDLALNNLVEETARLIQQL